MWIERALESLEREAASQDSCINETTEGTIEYSFAANGTADIVSEGGAHTSFDQSGVSQVEDVSMATEEEITATEGERSMGTVSNAAATATTTQVVQHSAHVHAQVGYDVRTQEVTSQDVTDEGDANGLDYYVGFEQQGGEIYYSYV